MLFPCQTCVLSEERLCVVRDVLHNPVPPHTTHTHTIKWIFFCGVISCSSHIAPWYYTMEKRLKSPLQRIQTCHSRMTPNNGFNYPYYRPTCLGNRSALYFDVLPKTDSCSLIQGLWFLTMWPTKQPKTTLKRLWWAAHRYFLMLGCQIPRLHVTLFGFPQQFGREVCTRKGKAKTSSTARGPLGLYYLNHRPWSHQKCRVLAFLGQRRYFEVDDLLTWGRRFLKNLGNLALQFPSKSFHCE